MSPPDEWKEEAYKAYVARWTAEQAEESERRKREGEVVLCLERAPGDPEVRDAKFQEELRAFSASLRATGLKFSQRAIAFDAVDGGGYPLPEFTVVIQALIAPVAGLCGAWLQARYGRKVRLKIGDVEAEGRSVAEIEALLKQAATFQDEARGKDDDT